jgi:hypothetical protein
MKEQNVFGVGRVRTIFDGSNGGESLRLCNELAKRGPLGGIAAELYRAQKASSRAKVYRGGMSFHNGGHASYRDLSYDRKNKMLVRLCERLEVDDCGLRWGWGKDVKQPFAQWVLYLELGNGQISFHSPTRFDGPKYDGGWDGKDASEDRIIAFCEAVLAGDVRATTERTCRTSRNDAPESEAKRNGTDATSA